MDVLMKRLEAEGEIGSGDEIIVMAGEHEEEACCSAWHRNQLSPTWQKGVWAAGLWMGVQKYEAGVHDDERVDNCSLYVLIDT
ncbi:hypothetical protein PTI98_004095 [Pleurotus ostreatus]|nr:hypothetical protein PTI98_004095 [Pleurotus ostreatus]